MRAEEYLLSNFMNKKILIIVPHQDDEICLAGSLIAMLRKAKIEVYIVYMTNGDYRFPEKVRMKEAVKALSCLGVPLKNIIFLGYGDTPNDETDHIFYHTGKKPYQSHAGRTATYGSRHYIDFATKEYGKANEYTRENLLNDIKSVILKVQPDIIIASDFDYHSDHRVLSILLEEAIGSMLLEQKEYRPMVYKGFTYSTAFYAESDYRGYNLQSTKWVQRRDKQFILDNPTYNWDDRIRFPVPAYARTKWLHKNIIFQAMRKHISQYGVHFANQIANGDEVFWARRTDSLTYDNDVEIKASSGNHFCLNDFKRLDSDDILKKEGRQLSFQKGLWIPKETDSDKSFTIFFQEKQNINRICFYENPDSRCNILKALLYMDNDYQFEITEIKHDGTKNDFIFPLQKEVKSLTFKLLETEGKYCGISEFEIYSPKIPELWYIKICIHDDFVYCYETSENTVLFELKAFNTFGEFMDCTNMHIIMKVKQNGQTKVINKKEVILEKKEALLQVTAVYNGSMVRDIIKIRRRHVSSNAFLKQGNRIIEAYYTQIGRIQNKICRLFYKVK